MDRKFVCDVSEEEKKKLQGIFEMKCALESLALQMTDNDDILREDSLLYSRMLEDYKNTMKDYNDFWVPYIEKYKDILDENTQLSMSFSENKVYVIPNEKIERG